MAVRFCRRPGAAERDIQGRNAASKPSMAVVMEAARRSRERGCELSGGCTYAESTRQRERACGNAAEQSQHTCIRGVNWEQNAGVVPMTLLSIGMWNKAAMLGGR